jgi:hypothetical protein
VLCSSQYPCLARGSIQDSALAQKLRLSGKFSSSDCFSPLLVAESGALSWKGYLLDWIQVLQQTRGVSSTGLTGREVLEEECVNLESGRYLRFVEEAACVGEIQWEDVHR